MDTDGSWVYKDGIVKPNKKSFGSTEEVGSSFAWLFYNDAKVYFYEWFGKILSDNQICEDRIKISIDAIDKE